MVVCHFSSTGALRTTLDYSIEHSGPPRFQLLLFKRHRTPHHPPNTCSTTYICLITLSGKTQRQTPTDISANRGIPGYFIFSSPGRTNVKIEPPSRQPCRTITYRCVKFARSLKAPSGRVVREFKFKGLFSESTRRAEQRRR